jgi:hypothetical protein
MEQKTGREISWCGPRHVERTSFRSQILDAKQGGGQSIVLLAA